MTMDWKESLARLQAGGSLPEGEDPAPRAEETAPESGQKSPLKVVVDRKGRKGKSATIIEGFELPDGEVADVAARLKKRLGTGGSSRGGEILIQGDCAAKAAEALRAMGFKVK